MASQQAVTQSAVEGAASAGMATGQAYKDSASQAGHSATQAMQSMSHVAGNQAIGNSGIQASKPSEIPKSSDAPQADGPPVCKTCGLQAPMGAKFCSKGHGALT